MMPVKKVMSDLAGERKVYYAPCGDNDVPVYALKYDEGGNRIVTQVDTYDQSEYINSFLETTDIKTLIKRYIRINGDHATVHDAINGVGDTTPLMVDPNPLVYVDTTIYANDLRSNIDRVREARVMIDKIAERSKSKNNEEVLTDAEQDSSKQ